MVQLNGWKLFTAKKMWDMLQRGLNGLVVYLCVRLCASKHLLQCSCQTETMYLISKEPSQTSWTSVKQQI